MEHLVQNQIIDQTYNLPPASEGRNFRVERLSVTPLRSTSYRVKKHRSRPKNKKPPDRSTERLPTLLPRKRSQKELQISSPCKWNIGICFTVDGSKPTLTNVVSSFRPTYPTDNMSEPNNSTASSRIGQDYLSRDDYQFMDPRELRRYYGSESELNVQLPPRPPWRREPDINIGSIPHTFCRHSECLARAEFTSNFPNATVTYDGVLLSKLYTSSYLWEETVRELGFIAIPDRPPPRMDPRTGRVLEPIGSLPLWVKVHGPDHNSIKLINFAVLPGSPAGAGVRGIIGERDLWMIYGKDLDIEQYNREREDEFRRSQQTRRI